MEPQFWNKRWRDNMIGFHEPAVNEQLMRFWPQLGLPQSARVFVPLCGKTLDMAWLAQQGHSILGVELSELAMRAFFDEQQMNPELAHADGFGIYTADAITLYCGDFFNLQERHLAGVDAVYDRASLIALPPSMRQAYAAKLSEMLLPKTQMLLLAVSYVQEQMDGPPFSVPESEVHQLYEAAFDIELLEHNDTLHKESKFQERGLTQFEVSAYRLQRLG